VNLYGDLKHERRLTSRLSGCGKAVDACLSGSSAPFDLFAKCPFWVGSSHSPIFLLEKYFRQNWRKESGGGVPTTKRMGCFQYYPPPLAFHCDSLGVSFSLYSLPKGINSLFSRW